MSRDLLIASAGGEVRAAVLEDGSPVDLVVEREERASLVGNIYIGRVRRLAPSLAAAFVDLGLARDGFLPLGSRRGAEEDTAPPPVPAEGEAVSVQVVRDASRNKGPQLSRRLSLAGCRLVLLPGGDRVAVSRLIEDEAERTRLAAVVEAIARDGEGFVVRTAAEGARDEELARDAAYLRTRWAEAEAARTMGTPPILLHAEPEPVERVLRDVALGPIDAIRVDDAAAFGRARAFFRRFAPDVEARLVLHRGAAPLFEMLGVEEAIEQALAPRVGLPSGGCIVIESTEALTAIDVNSGSLAATGGPPESALRTNLEAAAEVARQVRLRNLAGLIVIDFISMESDDAWQQVLTALADGIASDRNRVQIMGRTNAGLVEITRRRQRIPLAEALGERCGACRGTGRVPTAGTIARATLRRVRREARNGPAGALIITAAPEVLAAIEAACAGGVAGLGATLGRNIVLDAAPGAAREAVDLHIE